MEASNAAWRLYVAKRAGARAGLAGEPCPAPGLAPDEIEPFTAGHAAARLALFMVRSRSLCPACGALVIFSPRTRGQVAPHLVPGGSTDCRGVALEGDLSTHRGGVPLPAWLLEIAATIGEPGPWEDTGGAYQRVWPEGAQAAEVVVVAFPRAGAGWLLTDRETWNHLANGTVEGVDAVGQAKAAVDAMLRAPVALAAGRPGARVEPATSSRLQIPRAIVDEVRARTDIVAVIGRTVALEQDGRAWHGRCPFHKGVECSFKVVPEKGIFHCTGCGEGGDVVAFVMKTRGLSLRAAVQELADAAGVTVVTEEAPVRAATPSEGPRWVPRREMTHLFWLVANFPAEVAPVVAAADPAVLSDRRSVLDALIALASGAPILDVVSTTEDADLARALRAIGAREGVYTREEAAGVAAGFAAQLEGAGT